MNVDELEKKTVLQWDEEDFFSRAQRCQTFLIVHGFLSNSENEKVRNRIAKRRSGKTKEKAND